MKARLRKDIHKVSELEDFRMEMFMKANTKMANKTEQEFADGLMVQSTKVSTKKESGMDSEH